MYLVFENAEEPHRDSYKAIVISGVTEFGQVEVETDTGRDWVWKLKLANWQAYQTAAMQTGWTPSASEEYVLHFEPETQDVAWFFRLKHYNDGVIEFGHWRLLDKVVA